MSGYRYYLYASPWHERIEERRDAAGNVVSRGSRQPRTPLLDEMRSLYAALVDAGLQVYAIDAHEDARRHDRLGCIPCVVVEDAESIVVARAQVRRPEDADPGRFFEGGDYDPAALDTAREQKKVKEHQQVEDRKTGRAADRHATLLIADESLPWHVRYLLSKVMGRVPPPPPEKR